MSRGIGKVQRAILDAIVDGAWHHRRSIIRTAFGREGFYRGELSPFLVGVPADRVPTPAANESFRRAVRGLERRGIVDVEVTGRDQVEQVRLCTVLPASTQHLPAGVLFASTQHLPRASVA